MILALCSGTDKARLTGGHGLLPVLETKLYRDTVSLILFGLCLSPMAALAPQQQCRAVATAIV